MVANSQVEAMRTLQVCYALTTGEQDRYAEMSCVSMMLLRRVHPDARIILLVDEVTAPGLPQRCPMLQALADQVMRIETGMPTPLLRSRALKTTMRQHVEGDFLFLDADALPVRPLGGISAGRPQLAAALDLIGPDRQPKDPTWIEPHYRRMGWRYPPPRYLNSGVVWWADTPAARQLADEWHRRWRHMLETCRVPQDQPSFNSAIDALGVEVRILPIRYNAMIEACPGAARDASVFHYYASWQGGNRHTLLDHLVRHLQETGQIDWQRVEYAVRWHDPWAREQSVRWQWHIGHYGTAARLAARHLGQRLRRISVRNNGNR